MINRPRAAALLTILAAFALPAAAQELRFNVVPYRLDNGLKVLALEDHALPTVSYYTFFRVGSRDERPGRTGISHLFEHMMFNGAQKYGPKVFDRSLESRGGASNAGTMEDITVYYESFPSDALDLVVDMEADRMAALKISEEGLTSEREVVKEERRLRVDNDVEGALLELLRGTAYLAHPYQWPVVGWMPDLDAITVADCEAYFRTHYAPNNATIVIVGDFKSEKAIDLISKAYGAIPQQAPAPTVVRDEPVQRGERRAVLKKAAQLPSVAIAWHVSGTQSDDLYALDLLQTILGDGDSSRLVKSLVYDKELATRVYANNEWRIDPSTFILYAEAKPGVTPETLEAAMEAEVDRLAREGVGDDELRKAKNVRTTSLVKALKTNSGKAEQIGLFEVLFGNHQRLFTVVKGYEAMGKGDLMKVAAHYFTTDNRTVATLLPSAETAEEVGR
ncbi:MAG TPA: pitrilysin family protein [Candidatus Polarisedimenticolia bacterium]|nr:pitrilysin family protein [Candidatus Polarisedimenticolia bacterium]